MRTRVLRRPIVFLRFRWSILSLFIKTIRCSIHSSYTVLYVGFLKLAHMTVLLLRLRGRDVPIGRQRPLTYVCRGVFEIWWKYWYGIVSSRKDLRTIWDQVSTASLLKIQVRLQSSVMCHAVFLGNYLTVGRIVVPSSRLWLCRRRLNLWPGNPFFPVIPAHYRMYVF
jgi:hypothetical protein